MQFITVSVAVFASLLSLVAAKDDIRLPNSFLAPQPGEVIKAGTEYNVKWIADTKGKVKLVLRKGPSTDLDTLGLIAEIENKGSYLWAVKKDMESGADYALQIIDSDNEDEFNYTAQFTIASDVPASEDDKEEDKEETTSTKSGSATATASVTKTASADEEESTTLVTMTRSTSGTATESSTATSTDEEETAEPTEEVEESDGAAGALAVKGLGAVAGVVALAFFA